MPILLDGTYKTVTLAQAQSAIWNYRRYMNDRGIENIVNGFLIVHADIMQALGISQEFQHVYERFRGYIGLTDITNPPAHPEIGSEPAYSPWRLYVVPVDPAGYDVFPEVNHHKMVYDFNLPCPTTCDMTSPLVDLNKLG